MCRWTSVLLVGLGLICWGCGSGGGGGNNESDTAVLSGDVDAGSLARVPGRVANAVTTDIYVVAIAETGNEYSALIAHPFNDTSFSLEVPAGHDYIVEIREGSAVGPTLAVLVIQRTTGDEAVFALPAGGPDVNLGSVTLDFTGRTCTSDRDDDLESEVEGAYSKYEDADLDGDDLPDLFDRDDDSDGQYDDDDPYPDDTDDDGLSNDIDTDDDGDGIDDVDEDVGKQYDFDNDGISDDRDDDDDNDGISDDLDDDDDNDGIPDDGGTGGGTGDLTGTSWLLRMTTTSNSCEGDSSEPEEFMVGITQTGSTVLIDLPGGTQVDVTGSVEGSTMYLDSFQIPEDGGTTTVNATQLTIAGDGNSMSGNKTWSWTDGAFNCSGAGTIDLNRQ